MMSPIYSKKFQKKIINKYHRKGEKDGESLNKAESVRWGTEDGLETRLGENREERLAVGKREVSRVMLGPLASGKPMLPSERA